MLLNREYEGRRIDCLWDPREYAAGHLGTERSPRVGGPPGRPRGPRVEGAEGGAGVAELAAAREAARGGARVVAARLVGGGGDGGVGEGVQDVLGRLAGRGVHAALRGSIRQLACAEGDQIFPTRD